MRRDIPEPKAMLFAAIGAYTMYEVPSIAPVSGFVYFLLLWTALPRRGSTFEATLPIRGRDIFAARLLTHFALMALPLAAWMYASIVTLTPALSLSRVVDAPLVVLLALMLPYAVRPRELYEIPFLITAALWIGLAAVTGAVLWLLPPDVAFEALLIALVVVGRSIWMRIPDSLEMAPRNVGKAKAATMVSRESRPRSAWEPRAWRPYFHSLFGHSLATTLSYFSLHFVAFIYGSLGAGRIPPSFLIFVPLSITRTRRSTRWLAAFPLSNRARLWCVLGPSAVFMLALFALGRLASPLFLRPQDPMTYHAPDAAVGYGSTRVPLEFWRSIAPKVDPIVTAPWGESIAADTFSILGHALYNPYSKDSSNSPRFVEWQFQRATTAVFGAPISSDAYRQLKQRGELPTDALSTARMEVLNAATVLTLILLISFASERSYSYYNGLRGRLTSVVRWTIWCSLFAVMLLPAFFITGRATDVFAPLVEVLLLRLSTILPSNLVVVILVAAVPVVAVYALLERQFGKGDFMKPGEQGSTAEGFLSQPAPYYHTS